MICTGSRCKHAFCYICLVPWTRIITEGNQVHRQSCRHYRPIRKRVPSETRYRNQGTYTLPRLFWNGQRGIRDRPDHDEEERIARDRIAEDGGFLHDDHQRAVVQRGVTEDDAIGIEAVEANTGAGNINMQLGTRYRRSWRRPSGAA